MANNPFDPPIVQVKKTLGRTGFDSVNKGFGSTRTHGAAQSRPARPPATVGAEALSELNDVDVSSLENGQVLVWDASAGQWISGGLSLDALTDVDTTTVPPTFGQALVWNGSQWEPKTVGGGGGGSSLDDRRYIPGPGETPIDEFDDQAIDPAWVRVDGAGAPPANVVWKENVGQLMVEHTASADSASALHALLRPATPLDIGEAFYTAVTVYGQPNANYVMGGLILANGTTHGSGSQLINLLYVGTSAGITSDMRRFANFTTEQGTGGATTIPGAGILNYVRLVRVTHDTYRVDISPNGVAWVPGGATHQWTGTPTHVGFLSSNWGQSRAGAVTYEFLRRMQADTPPPPLPATITRTWSADGTNGIFNAVAMNSGSFSNPAGVFAISMSTTYDGTRVASRAVDGVLAQEAHTTNASAGQWWQVDFGATRRLKVTRAGIAGRNDSTHLPRNFEFAGSMDGTTWTVLASATGTDGPAQNAWWSSAVSNTTAWRYIRITQTGNNSSGDRYFTLGEVEFWGTLSTV